MVCFFWVIFTGLLMKDVMTYSFTTIRSFIMNICQTCNRNFSTLRARCEKKNHHTFINCPNRIYSQLNVIENDDKINDVQGNQEVDIYDIINNDELTIDLVETRFKPNFPAIEIMPLDNGNKVVFLTRLIKSTKK